MIIPVRKIKKDEINKWKQLRNENEEINQRARKEEVQTRGQGPGGGGVAVGGGGGAAVGGQRATGRACEPVATALV